MKIALATLKLSKNKYENLKNIEKYIIQAANNHSKLIVFSEAALTGLINNDDPINDLKLGEKIPGKVTQKLSELAKIYNMDIILGLFENDNNKLYDSAIFIDKFKGIKLKYRRISLGWHSEKADKNIYGKGKNIPIINTSYGKLSIIICGDLFDDNIVNRLKNKNIDLLFVPMARSFEDNTFNQRKWDNEEEIYYTERVKQIGIKTFIVNYLSDFDYSFGGTFYISNRGKMLSKYPLGKEGILYVNI